MILADAGLVTNPPTDYGRAQVPGRRNLYRQILRTPHNVVPEPHPDLVRYWGRVRIDANGRVAPLDGAADDAINALETAGPRKAAVFGAVAGLVFGDGLFGALAGGALGYISGKYLVGFAKKLLVAQQAAAAMSPKAAEGK